MAAVANIIDWTLISECPVPSDVSEILVPGETPIAAYKTFRDSAVFTDKRLIVRDSQGMTGRKVEAYSLPYSSILMWSSENGGTLDINSEIGIRTLVGQFRIKLRKGVDVRKLDRIISTACLS